MKASTITIYAYESRESLFRPPQNDQNCLHFKTVTSCPENRQLAHLLLHIIVFKIVTSCPENRQLSHLLLHVIIFQI